MQEDDSDERSEMTEEPETNIIPLWRARCITPFNPDLLPPEAVPLREEDVIVFYVPLTRTSNITYDSFHEKLIFKSGFSEEDHTIDKLHK